MVQDRFAARLRRLKLGVVWNQPDAVAQELADYVPVHVTAPAPKKVDAPSPDCPPVTESLPTTADGGQSQSGMHSPSLLRRTVPSLRNSDATEALERSGDGVAATDLPARVRNPLHPLLHWALTHGNATIVSLFLDNSYVHLKDFMARDLNAEAIDDFDAGILEGGTLDTQCVRLPGALDPAKTVEQKAVIERLSALSRHVHESWYKVRRG